MKRLMTFCLTMDRGGDPPHVNDWQRALAAAQTVADSMTAGTNPPVYFEWSDGSKAWGRLGREKTRVDIRYQPGCPHSNPDSTITLIQRGRETLKKE